AGSWLLAAQGRDDGVPGRWRRTARGTARTSWSAQAGRGMRLPEGSLRYRPRAARGVDPRVVRDSHREHVHQTRSGGRPDVVRRHVMRDEPVTGTRGRNGRQAGRVSSRPTTPLQAAALPLRELGCFARLVQAGLLALDLAGVAGEEALALERDAEVGV